MRGQEMPLYLTWRSICRGRRYAYVSLESGSSRRLSKEQKVPWRDGLRIASGDLSFSDGSFSQTILYCTVLYCTVLYLYLCLYLCFTLLSRKRFPVYSLKRSISQKSPQNPSPFAAGSEICSNNVRQILSAFPFFYTLHGRVFSRFPAS